MKRKRLSIVLGCVLALALMAGIAIPIASAATVTLNVLNPFANFQIQKNQPLSSREKFLNALGEVDLNGKYIGLSAYGKVGNTEAIQALGWLLMDEFPTVHIVNTGVTDLGSPWNNKTNANYDQWAGAVALGTTARDFAGANVSGARLDAVIFGVSD
ncbi:MAG: hypothetical protein LBH28_12075 [Oscillospiraceae bacterium]|nr:hypothetical protein [Oscillospiraceae bacterium]